MTPAEAEVRALRAEVARLTALLPTADERLALSTGMVAQPFRAYLERLAAGPAPTNIRCDGTTPEDT